MRIINKRKIFLTQKINSAKNEKTKTFYLRQEDIDANNIVEAFTEDPNLNIKEKNRSLNIFIEEILRDCYSQPGPKNYKEIVSLLKFGNFFASCVR